MSDQKNSSKSNYDRWKPGTKLACMMSLKAVCQDPKFYDQTNNKFNSLTWHTVAENLNKEYPYYAKRFTNINVKDRYDRVLKHHKVFKRMANKNNGFIWNPENFCFELNEELFKQYEEIGNNNKNHQNINNNTSNNNNNNNTSNNSSNSGLDDVISNELNVARFLSKPGHIDLEYFHRYIYQFPTQDELRNDTIINSPSYIEDAISKGILNLVTSGKPNFINKPTTLGGDITSGTNSTSEYHTSPLLLQQHQQHQQQRPPHLNHDRQSNSASSLGNNSNSSSSIPTSSISHHSNQTIPTNSSISSQSSIPIQHQHQHLQQQHHSLQHHSSNPNLPTPSSSSLPQNNTSSDLDFAGLINPSVAHDQTTQQHVILSSNLTGLPIMAPDLTHPSQSQAQAQAQTQSQSQSQSSSARGLLGQPHFKKPRTTSVPI